MKPDIISLIKIPDSIISKIYLKLFQEKNSLIILVFHSIYKNQAEKTLNYIDPRMGIQIDQFRQIVEYYLDNNYNFISQGDLLNGLRNDKYIMVTFDDGYYNNISILPELNRYKIPAIFFISTNHILKNKCFWWDVLYREKIKRGSSFKTIIKEQNHLKLKTNNEIEAYLIKIFGEKSLQPLSDIDRPFTPDELKTFSKEKYVHIGNHTSDHGILNNYSAHEQKSQILNAQQQIFNMTGSNPIAISYPDGSYSDETIKISNELGIKFGFTVCYKKNYLPIRNGDYFRLGRFDFGRGIQVVNQCEIFRSDKVLYTKFWNIINNNS